MYSLVSRLGVTALATTVRTTVWPSIFHQAHLSTSLSSSAAHELPLPYLHPSLPFQHAAFTSAVPINSGTQSHRRAL